MLARHFSETSLWINRILAAKINPLGRFHYGEERERDQLILSSIGDFYKSRSSHLSFPSPEIFLFAYDFKIDLTFSFSQFHPILALFPVPDESCSQILETLFSSRMKNRRREGDASSEFPARLFARKRVSAMMTFSSFESAV